MHLRHAERESSVLYTARAVRQRWSRSLGEGSRVAQRSPGVRMLRGIQGALALPRRLCRRVSVCEGVLLRAALPGPCTAFCKALQRRVSSCSIARCPQMLLCWNPAQRTRLQDFALSWPCLVKLSLAQLSLRDRQQPVI